MIPCILNSVGVTSLELTSTVVAAAAALRKLPSSTRLKSVTTSANSADGVASMSLDMAVYHHSFLHHEQLVNEVADIAEDNEADLTLAYARTTLKPKEKEPVPPKMDKHRDDYLEKRLQPQINRYLADAKRISTKVEYLKRIEGALITASAAIGPLSLVTDLGQTYALTVKKLSAWPIVANSCGIAIASHYHACKYEEEAGQWSNAAYELKNLRLKLPHSAEPLVGGAQAQETEWRAFVERCGQAIFECTVDWTMLKNRPDSPNSKDKVAKR
eukprot:scaffold4837_cov218-Skeletonema_marinoi.AAC.3